jgi:predicted dehydrogenase
VGCGIFGSIHARTYAEYEKAELVAVCDIDEAKARETAEKFGVSTYTSDFKDIAESTDIEAVSVATPDFAHLEPVLAMLEAGKNVLVEKPLATSPGEARTMINMANEKDLRLMTDFHNRFSPAFLRAKEAIDAGEIGAPVMAYIRLSNTLEVPLDMLGWSGKSGPQWFLFPHTVDIVRWLISQEPREVYASASRQHLKKQGVDAYDAIQALVKFDEAFVTFETAWILPQSWPSVIDFVASILGTEGKIDLDLTNTGISISGEKFSYPFYIGEQEAHGRTEGFFRLPIMHFVDRVLDGAEMVIKPEDGFVATAVIEAMEKSIASGQPEKVEEF